MYLQSLSMHTTFFTTHIPTPQHVIIIDPILVPIWSTVMIYLKLQVSRTKLILRGEGCNSPNLIHILMTPMYFNYKLIKLGAPFPFNFFFLMIRRPPRSTLSSSSAASDVYKRQELDVPAKFEHTHNIFHNPHSSSTTCHHNRSNPCTYLKYDNDFS